MNIKVVSRTVFILKFISVLEHTRKFGVSSLANFRCVKKFINWWFCALVMKKSIVQTNAGLYTIYFPNDDSRIAEVYRGRNNGGGQIGDLLLGSLERLPDSGVDFENGEYAVTAQRTEDFVRQEAPMHETMQTWNYIVVRQIDGKLRILPQTRSVESGLTKRLRAVESSSKNAKP